MEHNIFMWTVILFGIIIFLALRANIIFSYHFNALLILRRKPDVGYVDSHEAIKKYGHVWSHVLDIRKWVFQDFFPDL